MTDIAELGVVIDAKPIKAASDALRDLTGVGKITEEVLKRLTDTGKRLTDADESAATASKEVAAATKRQAAEKEKLLAIQLRSAVMTEKTNRLAYEEIAARDAARLRAARALELEQTLGPVQAKIIAEDKLTAVLNRQAAARQKLNDLSRQKALGASMARDLADHSKALEMNEKLTASLEKSTLATDKQRGAIRQAAHEMRSFALDITGAAYLLAGFTAALAAPAVLGVKLSSTLENTRLGMASILVSMGRIDGASFGLPKALEISSVMTKQLVADSLKYGVSIESLANTLRSTLAPGLASGLGLKQIQELATLGTLAVKTIGLDAKQTVQEVRDLVSGGITAASSTLATSLGVKDSDIKRWREAGTLYTELVERLRGFSEASEASTKTLTGAWEQLKTKVSLLLSDESGFTAIKDVLISISSYIGEIDQTTGKIKFNSEALDTAKAYWSILKDILETLQLIGKVAAYRIEITPEGAKKLALDIAGVVDSAGAAIAGGIKDAIKKAVYGQTTELAAPRGLGLGEKPFDMTPPVFTKKTDDLDKVTGTLGARLTAAEEFWKKFHTITREGLLEEHQANLKAFEEQRILLKKQAELGRLADTPEALKRNAEDDLDRMKRFGAAKREELERYSRRIKALDDEEAARKKKLYAEEAHEFNMQIEARRAMEVAHAREIKSIDEKIHAIDQLTAKEVSRGEASRRLAAENRQTAGYLSIEATGDFGPVAPGTSELAGKYSSLADKQQAQGTRLDTEDYAARNAEAARRVADAWKQTAESIRNALGDAFGSGGQALSGFVGAYADGYARLADIEANRQKQLENTKLTAEEAAAIQSQAAQQTELATLHSYAGMATAAKGFFEKGSKGYEALQRAEQVFRLFEFAMSVKAIAVGAAETAAKVAQNGVKTSTGMAAGAAGMFASLGPAGFAAVGAMVAVMASLGAKGGGGSVGSYNSEELQKTQGTGGVLGDNSAKNNSLSNSFDIVSKNTGALLTYTQEMVGALKSIERSLGGLGAALARQLGAKEGIFDQSGLSLGSNGGFGNKILALVPGLASLGVGKWAGEIGNAIFGGKTKTTLVGQGLKFGSQSIGDATEALQAEGYQITKTKKSGGLLSSSKTSYQEYTSKLDGEVTRWLENTITTLRDGVVKAAGILGVTGAKETVDALALGLDKIDLTGMNGEQISKTLTEVMGEVFGNMAEAVVPTLQEFQKVGEGLGETLTRVAEDYAVVDVSLASIGTAFETVGVNSITARERLLELSGGIDAFQKGVDFFQKNFLTAGEVTTIMSAQVRSELTALGYAGVDTRDEFKALVLGLDLSTEAGAALWAKLMNLAPAFDAVAKATEALAAKRLDMEIQLLQVSGDSVGALALQRGKELAALDESLRPLQEQIYAQQDLNKAYEKAASTLKSLKLLTTDSFATLFDYTKYLHKAVKAGISGAEAALPANPSNTFIPGKSNTSANADLVAAIDKLRAEQQAGQIAMSTYLQQTAAILRRWNGDGMPEVRAVAA